MNRLQRRRVAAKRRFVLAYAVATVLTLGLLPIVIVVTLDQRPWSFTWFGCWGFVLHQLVALVIHARNTYRTHREHEALIEEYSEQQEGSAWT